MQADFDTGFRQRGHAKPVSTDLIECSRCGNYHPAGDCPATDETSICLESLASGFVEVTAFVCPRCGEMFSCNEADECDDPACPGK